MSLCPYCSELMGGSIPALGKRCTCERPPDFGKVCEHGTLARKCDTCLLASDIATHLADTGHTTLASMRAEFDAMRAILSNAKPVDERFFFSLNVLKSYWEAWKATDAAREGKPQ